MNSAESFSATYAEARAKFLEAAESCGGALERFENPNRGPDGGDLSTDVAWFGPRRAEKVLVMVSGTHGGEAVVGLHQRLDRLGHGAGGIVGGEIVALGHWHPSHSASGLIRRRLDLANPPGGNA